jgi:hypothetical protein
VPTLKRLTIQGALCVPSVSAGNLATSPVPGTVSQGALPLGRSQTQTVPSNERTSLPASFVQQLSRLTRLTKLTLLENVCEASLRHAGVLTTLRSLQLVPTNHYRLHRSSAASLSELTALTQLTELVLHWSFEAEFSHSATAESATRGCPGPNCQGCCGWSW